MNNRLNNRLNNRPRGVPRRFPLSAFLSLSAALILPSVLAAESVSLEDLLLRTGAEMRWDPMRRMGQLSKGGTVLVFQPGDSWMVLNGRRLVVTGTVIEEEGRLIFSREAADTILSLFGVSGGPTASYTLKTILIDPGHGGRDSGASRIWPVDGVDVRLPEKDVVLEISFRLAEKLKASFPGKDVILTRDRDIYPTLEDRVALANGVRLDAREGMIYISIHANASLSTSAQGYEVWYLPRDYRRTLVDPRRLGGHGSSIAPIVNALWEEEFTHESVRLAEMILRGFRDRLGPDVPNRGRREESWFVVRNARMASVLIEVGFLTNAEEAARIRRPEYLSRLSDGIYTGISDFITFFENRGG